MTELAPAAGGVPFGVATNPLVSKGICKQLAARSRRTPDFAELRMMREIPLVVYGVEMKYGDASEYLKSANYYGHVHSISENFIMKEGRRHPVVFTCAKDNVLKGKIRGELYGVTVEHIHALDAYNSNGNMFKRVKKRFQFEDCMPKDAKMLRGLAYDFAYVYLGMVPYWQNYPMKVRSKVTYQTRPGLGNTPYYEFFNRSLQRDDPADDEWGYGLEYAGGYSHEPHIG